MDVAHPRRSTADDRAVIVHLMDNGYTAVAAAREVDGTQGRQPGGGVAIMKRGTLATGMPAATGSRPPEKKINRSLIMQGGTGSSLRENSGKPSTWSVLWTPSDGKNSFAPFTRFYISNCVYSITVGRGG